MYEAQSLMVSCHICATYRVEATHACKPFCQPCKSRSTSDVTPVVEPQLTLLPVNLTLHPAAAAAAAAVLWHCEDEKEGDPWLHLSA